jgi:hypothetical protein
MKPYKIESHLRNGHTHTQLEGSNKITQKNNGYWLPLLDMLSQHRFKTRLPFFSCTPQEW